MLIFLRKGYVSADVLPIIQKIDKFTANAIKQEQPTPPCTLAKKWMSLNSMNEFTVRLTKVPFQGESMTSGKLGNLIQPAKLVSIKLLLIMVLDSKAIA